MDGGVTGLVSGDVQKPQKPGVTGAKPGSHALTRNGCVSHPALMPAFGGTIIYA